MEEHARESQEDKPLASIQQCEIEVRGKATRNTHIVLIGKGPKARSDVRKRSSDEDSKNRRSRCVLTHNSYDRSEQQSESVSRERKASISVRTNHHTHTMEVLTYAMGQDSLYMRV